MIFEMLREGIIKDVIEPAPWRACLRDDPGGIGVVKSRLMAGSVTLFLRVRLLDGRHVLVLPYLVGALPSQNPADLTIPPVPESAVTVCGRRS